MAYVGDTVRLKVKFVRFDGVAVDPTALTIKVYEDENTLIETITTGITNAGVGIYTYDYVVPAGLNDFIIVEFAGTAGGKPILARDKIRRTFA